MGGMRRTGLHRWHWRLILCAVACLAMVAPAAGGSQDGALLPTKMCGDYFFVPITLAARDGAPADAESRTLRLLFDTGASSTSIDPDALERVSGRRINAGRRVTIHRLGAGPVTWSRLRARVREMDHLGHALNRPFDGILGFDAFEDVLVTLDYPAQEMRVALGELPAPDGRRIFRYHEDSSDRPFLDLRIGGKTRRMLIDSGASGAFNLEPSDEALWAAPPIPLSASMRINRLVLNRSGRLGESVAIGPVVFEKPIARLTDDTELFGAKVMRHMSWTFDQRARRVRIEPAASSPIHMPPIRNIGAAYHPRAAGLEVVHLMPQGPAQRAGIEKGDLIIALDGTPLADLGCMREAMRDPAADAWTLGVLRDGRTLEVRVEIDTLLP